ncbi:TPM domain-containing protein [Parapedobacter defluvii]|nr:TPM domain-containing protein [Parapedobacter defluvii]
MMLIRQITFTLIHGLLLCAMMCPVAVAQYSLTAIPNPKQQGQDFFVSNPENILSGYTVDSLNALAREIEGQTTAEVAIVAISDFVGDDDFEFALELFQTWGIGKRENDNGLLLFIATERRAYRFITGYGTEAVLPDALLKRIGEQYLVPEFRLGNYDAGMLAAISAIRDILLNPESTDELQAEMRQQSFFYRYQDVGGYSLMIIVLTFIAMKWIGYVAERKVVKNKRYKSVGQNGIAAVGGCGCMLMILFIGVFALWFTGMQPEVIFQANLIPWYLAVGGSLAIAIKYSKGEEYIRKAYRDDKNRLSALATYHRWMILPLLLSPLSLVGLLVFLKRRNAMQVRFIPPDDSGNWKRLDRDQLKTKTDLLDNGQLSEEKILSRSYQIWEHVQTGEIKTVGWDGLRKKNFSECPSCHYRTLKKPYVKTIKAATYSAPGEGERIEECAFCDYRVSLGTVVIPKKVHRSSSSSGSGSSSGGGSSGSFGGGSSGGGGAGGRW